MPTEVGLLRRARSNVAYPSLVLLGMVDAAGYSVIAPLLPAISRSTDAGPGMIGVLVASFPAGMLIGFWAAGEMLTRCRCEAVLAVALGIVATGCVVFIAADDLNLYLLGRAVMGAGSGGLWMGVTFSTLERWPGDEYLCMSRIFAAYSIGGLIGPSLGTIGGVRGPLSAFLGLVCLGAVALALSPPPPRRRRFGADVSALRLGGFRLAAAGILFAVLALGIIEGVLPLHVASHLRQTEIAVLYVGGSVLVALAATAAGSFAPRRMLAGALGLVVAGIAGASATSGVGLWLPSLAAAAVGLGLGQTGALGILLDAVTTDRIVTAMVVWSQIGIVGYLVGPLAGGALVELAGYWAVGLLPLTAALIVVAVSRGASTVERSAPPPNTR
jgi:predicted MFS family arabinose efflux permease